MVAENFKDGYMCSCCGQFHAGLPLHYGTSAPALWFRIPENEREDRAMLSDDLCLIDEQYGFILGNLEIPIMGTAEVLSWDVWASLSLPNFKRCFQLWEQPGRESEPAYFGWLSTLLPCYPETLHLKTMVHTRKVGLRPYLELEQTDHPLAVEQRQGITWQRIQEIAEQVRHGSSSHA